MVSRIPLSLPFGHDAEDADGNVLEVVPQRVGFRDIKCATVCSGSITVM